MLALVLLKSSLTAGEKSNILRKANSKFPGKQTNLVLKVWPGDHLLPGATPAQLTST